MAYKTALRLSAVVFALLGLLALVYIGEAYRLFAGTALGFPADGAVDDRSMFALTTLSFLRLSCGFLISLGVLVWRLAEIQGREIQRHVCRSLCYAFVVILIVAITQQTAIWSSAAWSFVVLLLLAAATYYRLSIALKTVSSQTGDKAANT